MWCPSPFPLLPPAAFVRGAVGGIAVRRRGLGLLGVAMALIAVLLPVPAHAAGTVTVTISGKGDVSGPGIACSEALDADCTQYYPDDEEQICQDAGPCTTIRTSPTVELAAADRAGTGYVFSGWQGCDSVSGPEARTCQLTVRGDRTLTPTYADVEPPRIQGLSLYDMSSSGGPEVRGAIDLVTYPSDNSGTVSRVEFQVRGALVAVRSGAPFLVRGFDTTAVPDGPATIRATAFDAAGHSASVETTVTFDNTAPLVSVTSGPDQTTHGPGSTLSWAFTASDATTGVRAVECSVVPAGQAPSYGACTGASSHEVADLPDGDHRFTVRAWDQASNRTVVERSFTVDALAPETTVTSGPAEGAMIATDSVTFGLGSDDPAAVLACRLYPDAATPPAFAPCSSASAHTASGLAEGGYVFEARATDAVGNSDATPARRTFVVDLPEPAPTEPAPTEPAPTEPAPTEPLPDRTAPETTIVKAPKARIRTTRRTVKVTFAFSTSEPGSTFWCRLDGAAFKPCGPVTRFRVMKGKHVLAVRSVDAAGNVDATPARRRFRVLRRLG